MARGIVISQISREPTWAPSPWVLYQEPYPTRCVWVSQVQYPNSTCLHENLIQHNIRNVCLLVFCVERLLTQSTSANHLNKSNVFRESDHRSMKKLLKQNFLTTIGNLQSNINLAVRTRKTLLVVVRTLMVWKSERSFGWCFFHWSSVCEQK